MYIYIVVFTFYDNLEDIYIYFFFCSFFTFPFQGGNTIHRLQQQEYELCFGFPPLELDCFAIQSVHVLVGIFSGTDSTQIPVNTFACYFILAKPPASEEGNPKQSPYSCCYSLWMLFPPQFDKGEKRAKKSIYIYLPNYHKK